MSAFSASGRLSVTRATRPTVSMIRVSAAKGTSGVAGHGSPRPTGAVPPGNKGPPSAGEDAASALAGRAMIGRAAALREPRSTVPGSRASGRARPPGRRRGSGAGNSRASRRSARSRARSSRRPQRPRRAPRGSPSARRPAAVGGPPPCAQASPRHGAATGAPGAALRTRRCCRAPRRGSGRGAPP